MSSGRKWSTELAFLGGALAAAWCALGCSAAAPRGSSAMEPSGDEAEATDSESSAGQPSEAPPASEAEPATGSSAPIPSEAVTLPDVAAICSNLCARTEKACNERAAQFCTASCRDYVSAAEKCPLEVARALECQSHADDFILCSNIAPEDCAAHFRKMKDCRSGSVPPEDPRATTTASTQVKSAGWSKVAVAELGLETPFPTEHAALTEPGKPGIVAKVGEVTFRVESFPGPSGKVTDAGLLRAVTAFVGNPCQPKLRLHGRYETSGIIHVRFSTVCSDGVAIEGMIHIVSRSGQNQWVAASARTPAGAPSAAGAPSLDEFFYGLSFAAP